MRQHSFSLILIQDILMLNSIRKQRSTKLLPMWMSLLSIVTIFWIQLLNHKLTYSGLLLNFDSFTSYFYKKNVIKCLTDLADKINDTWASF